VGKVKKVDAILTSDWHLTTRTPVCRTDNYLNTQLDKLDEIADLASEHNCYVIVAGDIFDRWNCDWRIIRYWYEFCQNNKTIWCAGQHDLQDNNADNLDTSPIMAGKVTAWDCVDICHWGRVPSEEKNILAWHVPVYHKENPYHAEVSTAKALLKKYPQYRLILTGDNHQTFVVEHNGALLVNTGSLLRSSAAQINHKPCVFLYDFDNNAVEPYFLDIDEDAVTDNHLVTKKFKEDVSSKVSKFCDKMSSADYKIDFHANLKKYMETNDIDDAVVCEINKTMEKAK